MPVSYTEAIWRALYAFRPHSSLSTPLTYSRDYEFWSGWDNGQVARGEARRHQTRRDWLTGYGLDNNARTIHIGCAYGFLMEYLIDAGITDVWGIEPSPWIWANTSEIRADVLPKIVNATVGVDSLSTIQGLFQAAGMGNPRKGDWILDEDAISSSLNDTEIANFIAGCEDLLQGNAKGRIIHIVTPLATSGIPGDSALLWKTMADWKAYAPDHTWVNALTGAIA